MKCRPTVIFLTHIIIEDVDNHQGQEGQEEADEDDCDHHSEADVLFPDGEGGGLLQRSSRGTQGAGVGSSGCDVTAGLANLGKKQLLSLILLV